MHIPPPLQGLPRPLHLHLLNSEHLWEADSANHGEMDVYLCKTRFCERLLLAHAAQRGWEGEVRFMGHSSSDPTVDLPHGVRRQKVCVLCAVWGCWEGEVRCMGPQQQAASRSPHACACSWHKHHTLNPSGWLPACEGQVGPQAHKPAARVLGRVLLPPPSHTAHWFLHTTRQVGFLHVKGKSGLKHTNQLMECWGGRPEWPLLHVVGRFTWDEVKKVAGAKNIAIYPNVSVWLGVSACALQWALATDAAGFLQALQLPSPPFPTHTNDTT